MKQLCDMSEGPKLREHAGGKGRLRVSGLCGQMVAEEMELKRAFQVEGTGSAKAQRVGEKGMRAETANGLVWLSSSTS